MSVAQSNGWWNSDDPLTTTCIRVKVLDCKVCDATETVATGVTVWATGTDYTGEVTTDTTDLIDTNDTACLFVKASSSAASAHVVLKVEKGSLTGESVEVTTPSNLLSVCDLNCPLTVVHLNSTAIASSDPLDAMWCATNNGVNGSPFDTVWLNTQVNAFPSSVTLTIEPCIGANCQNQAYKSGEYKSDCFHGYGRYEVTITPPAQQWNSIAVDSEIKGLVTAFFTYTYSGDGTAGAGIADWHDEIDIELIGPQAGTKRLPAEHHDYRPMQRHRSRRPHELLRETQCRRRTARARLLRVLRDAHLQLRLVGHANRLGDRRPSVAHRVATHDLASEGRLADAAGAHLHEPLGRGLDDRFVGGRTV